MPSVSTAVQGAEHLPSATVRAAETTLLGLSFGEHDGGQQRLSISRRLASITHLWASGLLKSDHGPAELQATALALSSLITTPSAADLVRWEEFDPSDADAIALHYWRAAANTLTTLTLPDTTPRENEDESEPRQEAPTPAEEALRNLRAARELLHRAANAPSRRSGAANTAPGDLIFAALRLDLSAQAHPSPTSAKAREEATASLAQLRGMRRADTTAHLISGAFHPSLHDALLRAQRGPEARDARDAGVAPLAEVVYAVCAASVEARVDARRLPALLDVVLPLVEDVEAASRVVALDALALLAALVSDAEWAPLASRVAPCLLGAIVWRDAASGIRAAPLVRRFLPLLLPGEMRVMGVPLCEDVPEEWTAGLKLVMGNVSYHVVRAGRDDEDPLDGESGATHAGAAVELMGVVPHVARQRLLRYAETWVPVVASVLPLLARLFGSSAAVVGEFEKVADALMESLKWTWMLERVYRVQVFEACMCSVLEARACGNVERGEIREVGLQILSCLADCAGSSAVLQLIDAVQVESAKYKSLHDADEFFSEVRVLLSDRADEKRPVFAGRLVSKFFTEVT